MRGRWEVVVCCCFFTKGQGEDELARAGKKEGYVRISLRGMLYRLVRRVASCW